VSLYEPSVKATIVCQSTSGGCQWGTEVSNED
jgi:hypothetical protein